MTLLKRPRARPRDTEAAARPAAAPAAAGPAEGWESGALLLLTLVTVCFGLLELYSASSLMAQAEGLPSHFFALRQAVGAAIGLVLLLAVARLDYTRLQRLAWPLLAVVTLMLLVVVLPGTEGIAPRINGARRWLNLGISFQPSEFAKLALIVWTAALAVKKQDRLHSLSKGLAPFLVVWGMIVLLVYLQPNLSAALLLALLSALVLFAGGARIGHFLLLGAVAVPLLLHMIGGASYRAQRLATFLDPSGDVAGSAWQIHQSLIAIGSGGLTGVGFGESRQKFGFLPEPHNDFIFSMIAEEWGFGGVVFTVALFAAFGAIGFRIARRAPDLFGYLLAVGMTSLLVVSALLHMGVALSLLPTTGVVLPFISYGRSGLLVAFVAVGVLMSVSRASRPREARR